MLEFGAVEHLKGVKSTGQRAAELLKFLGAELTVDQVNTLLHLDPNSTKPGTRAIMLELALHGRIAVVSAGFYGETMKVKYREKPSFGSGTITWHGSDPSTMATTVTGRYVRPPTMIHDEVQYYTEVPSTSYAWSVLPSEVRVTEGIQPLDQQARDLLPATLGWGHPNSEYSRDTPTPGATVSWTGHIRPHFRSRNVQQLSEEVYPGRIVRTFQDEHGAGWVESVPLGPAPTPDPAVSPVQEAAYTRHRDVSLGVDMSGVMFSPYGSSMLGPTIFNARVE